MTPQERAALEQEIPEIVRLLRHVRGLDCGAHYCRYCPAKSPAWEHTASCPYEESQRIHTEAQALIPRLASLLTPSSPEQGWQPIETAPQDGDTIIVFDPNYAQPVVPGMWDRDEESEGGQCWRAADAAWDRLQPTHWMPLPDPPASSPSVEPSSPLAP